MCSVYAGGDRLSEPVGSPSSRCRGRRPLREPPGSIAWPLQSSLAAGGAFHRPFGSSRVIVRDQVSEAVQGGVRRGRRANSVRRASGMLASVTPQASRACTGTSRSTHGGCSAQTGCRFRAFVIRQVPQNTPPGAQRPVLSGASSPARARHRTACQCFAVAGATSRDRMRVRQTCAIGQAARGWLAGPRGLGRGSVIAPPARQTPETASQSRLGQRHGLAAAGCCHGCGHATFCSPSDRPHSGDISAGQRSALGGTRTPSLLIRSRRRGRTGADRGAVNPGHGHGCPPLAAGVRAPGCCQRCGHAGTAVASRSPALRTRCQPSTAGRSTRSGVAGAGTIARTTSTAAVVEPSSRLRRLIEQRRLAVRHRRRLRHLQRPGARRVRVAPAGQAAVIDGQVDADPGAAEHGRDERGGAGAAERVDHDSGPDRRRVVRAAARIPGDVLAGRRGAGRCLAHAGSMTPRPSR